MKMLKWLLIAGGSLVVLVIAALLLIPMFVDVDQYKPTIEKQVSSAVGRPFAIKGPLKLSLFPWAGVAFSDLHLGSPPGYREKEFLVVKSFDVRMKLLPLLFKDMQVQRFVVEGPRVVLERDKAGRGNWEAWGAPLGTAPSKPGAPPAPKEPTGGLPLKSLAVGEFAVRNGSVVFIDQASGARHEVSDVTLELKDVSLDRPIHLTFSAVKDKMPVSVEGRIGPVGSEPGKGKLPLDLSVKALHELAVNLKGHVEDATATPRFDLELAVNAFSPRKAFAALGAPFPVATADPAALSRVGFKTKIQGNTQQVRLTDGVLDLDESKLSFSAAAKDFSKPDIAFDLNLDKINADRYLPPAAEKGAPEAKKGPPAESKKTDYTPLRRLVLDGKARVGTLTAQGMTIQDIRLTVTGQNGVIQLDPLLANLYKGALSAKATLDVRQDAPRANLNLETKNVQAGPLLQDFLKKDFLEGAANVEATLSMAGDAPERIKRSLNGKGQIVFADGAIKGIDLAGMVRNVASAFGAAQPGAERPRTDFSELNAPFTVTDGVVNTPGTTLASPLLRVLATGKANLVDESLDLRVEPRVVGTLKGQGDIKERSGVMVPVLVKGTFSSPSFQPDIRGMLEKGLKEGTIPGAKELLKPLEGQPKTKDDALKGIFRGLTGK
jgi:AsmA protein